MAIQRFSLNDFSYDMGSMKEGGEGCVLKAVHCRHGEVAAKILLEFSDITIKEAELLMENAYHQNIIQLLGLLVDENSKCVGYIMPYMSMGSLEDVIRDESQHYDEQQIKSWIRQICYGLSYLHDKKIIHRDIKPSNVLLGKSRDDVKLSDFGMARSLADITHTLTSAFGHIENAFSEIFRRGTIYYMAPEIFQGENYDISADVYSLSITIWEILYRRIPFDHVGAESEYELLFQISEGVRPKLENNLSEAMNNFLTRCWQMDVSKRPTIGDILEFSTNTKFLSTDLENSTNEFVTLFEDLNVHNNDDESLPQIPLNRSNENFAEEQTILLLGGWDGNNCDSLLILENNQQNWKQLNIKAPYEIYNYGIQFLNSNIYIFGGFGKEELLDTTYKLSKSLQWEKMNDMNQEPHRISNSSVILNNQIWVCGGEDEYGSVKSVEMYDPLTNKWKCMKEMSENRGDAAAAVVNGKIFCSGGFNGKYPLNSVEWYDPSSDVWTLICTMPEGRRGHSAIEMNGNFITMGGRCKKEWFNNEWALDTMDENAVWIKKPSMSIPRKYFSIAKIDSKIFACGGYGELTISTDSVEIFDGEVWRNGPQMPTRRRSTAAIVIPMQFARYLK